MEAQILEMVYGIIVSVGVPLISYFSRKGSVFQGKMLTELRNMKIAIRENSDEIEEHKIDHLFNR